jgi:hypothetical protein
VTAPVALERFEKLADGHILCRFPKAQPDGATQLRLTPLAPICQIPVPA